MVRVIPIGFDPTCRYSPQLSQIQELLGPGCQLLESDHPRFLLYGPFSISWKQSVKSWLNQIRWRQAKRIFWTGENARPDFSRFDWCVTFDYDDMVQHPRHLRRPVCPQLKELIEPSHLPPESRLNRKFCNFLYSQPGRVREQFFELLNQYRRVDAPGVSKNNMSALGEQRAPLASRMQQDWLQQRRDFVQQYKFTIAFENSSYPGYVTEKMWHTLLSGSVPIYWGNPMAYRDFNPKCYIDVHAFSSLHEVVDWVRQVDSDDSLYLSYFREPAVAQVDRLAAMWERYRQGLRRIFLED